MNNSTKPWRMGVIGYGWAGEQHVRAMRQLPDQVQLAGLAETNEAIARRVAEDLNLPYWTTDYQELLTKARLDAVSICLPHRLHAPVTIAAAEAGLHILVEKPIAPTLSEADAMIAAADKAGVKLMVAENSRYHPVFRKAAEIAASSELGDIFLVRIAREHNARDYLHERPWFLSDADAGILTSGGIHDFELLQMLAGDIEHVYALEGTKAFPEMKADDNVVAIAGLHNGAVGMLVEAFSMRTPRPNVFGTVHGNLGSLWFDDVSLRLYTAEQDGRPDLMRPVEVPPGDTFVTEMAHFLDCLEQPEKEPLTSGRQARQPLVAVRACYESIRTGQRVVLAEFDQG